MDEPTPSLAAEIFALKHVEKNGAGRPQRCWKSCRLYERLAADGFLNEVPDENAFFRRFEITNLGRQALLLALSTRPDGQARP